MADLRERLAQDAGFREKFQLGEKLGEGAMGTVFRATQRSLGRPVAIKFLSEGLARDEQCRTRFAAEARMAARLSHANLVTVHDSGDAAGLPYIVCEYVDGKTLRRRMDEGAVPLREALELGAQICEGLRAAHEQGILHRDIKPENILVTHQGQAKIADFGIAKDLLLSLSATQPGAIVGTPLYLSPEQAEGRVATPQSDIYSAGCVIFEMLTRRLPFDADNFMGLMRAKLSERAPRADLLHPSVPARVGALLAVALERDPALRYSSAEGLATALRKALGLPELQSPARQASAGDSPRIPSGATPTLVRGSPGVRVISGPSPAVVLSSAPTFPWVPVTAAACVTLLVAAGLAALTVYLPREEKQPQPAAGPLAWLVRDSKSSRPLDAATRPLVAVRLEPQGAAARPQPAPPAPAPPSAAVPAVAPPPAPPPAPRLARRAGESNLAWLTREPESRAAFQACLASEADRLSIEAILSPRQRQSAAVAALLARLKMEFGETSAVAPLVRGALDRSANGLLVPQDIRDLMDEVCRWLGDVTLLTETAPVLPTEVSGIEPSLRRGRHLLGKRDAVGALEVYRALVESGYPEAGVWLPRAVAHLVAGDSFGAALDSRLYLANPGMERGKTVAVFVFSEAVGTLGSRRLAARARVELASLPLPPSQLQELLEWDRRLVERSREKPSDSVDDLPVSAVLLEGPAGKDEWAARGWPLKAFEALAESPDAERVANGPELFPRLYRFLSGP